MPMLDAHVIVPLLWQGGVPPTGKTLAKLGFKMLVLCARERQLPADLFPGVEVVHAPNDDHEAMPLDRAKLRLAIEASGRVAAALDRGHQVLVTCRAGLNRSGLVTALSMHRFLGWSGDRCIEQIRKNRRSLTHPRLKPLCNTEFAAILRRLPARESSFAMPSVA